MQILDVVNDMLATMGEAPLNSLSEPHEFLTAARRALDKYNRQIQSLGWWFNRDTVTLQPSITGTIALPGDTLEFRCATDGVTKRGNFLYNTVAGTNTFDAAVEGQVLRLIPFEELPETAASYIAAAAVAYFQVNYDGDQVKARALAEREARTRADLHAEETRQVKVNMIQNSPRLAYIKLITRSGSRRGRP